MKEENKDKKVQAAEATEVEEVGTITESGEVEDVSKYIVIPDMYITRKTTNKGGRDYSDFTVHGVLRGVPVEVRVRPGKDESGFTDVNAYKLMNIVFGTDSECLFAVQTRKRRDTATGRVISSLCYFAYVKDAEDLVEYVAPLRFETQSDRSILTQLIAKSNGKYGLGLTV